MSRRYGLITPPSCRSSNPARCAGLSPPRARESHRCRLCPRSARPGLATTKRTSSMASSRRRRRRPRYSLASPLSSAARSKPPTCRPSSPSKGCFPSGRAARNSAPTCGGKSTNTAASSVRPTSPSNSAPPLRGAGRTRRGTRDGRSIHARADIEPETMERSFKHEVQALKLGDGDTFRGEGILAVTKALLQSGVSYVGGYQGAPVSHLLDVLVDAEDIIGDLGVHLETCTNEASAAAMLGASINYPLRGAVTWKSIVGTNVAADALSNLSSPGVVGGVMILLGEDYGEGASVIQERSYDYALKSSIWLLDPRPDLPTIVRMVEEGFELSEASHAPVMMELRIRACHVTGEFKTKANRRAEFSGRNRLAGPPRFDYARLAHPPVIYSQARLKVEERLPAARQFIRARKLNEVIAGEIAEIGIIVLGGLTNGVLRALERLDLGDLYGASRVPIYVLNVAFPLVPEELREFCAGKRAVLVIEEGTPDYVEQMVNVELRRADMTTRVFGKDVLPRTGEYTSDVLINGLASFLEQPGPAGIDADATATRAQRMLAHKSAAVVALGDIPPRPPNFCTGCPERPVFSAIKLMQRELGPTHISADIGCHSFATFAPFSLGNSILGYGMSLASAAAVAPNMKKRPIAVMGDGGFWHNGLITGVASNLFNKGDGVLVIMQNGYASATGQQYLPSSNAHRTGGPTGISIEKTLRALGVKWLRTVRSYSVAKMAATLKQAMQSAERGLKVIIADGECMLVRQRRIRIEQAEQLKRGARVVKT